MNIGQHLLINKVKKSKTYGAIKNIGKEVMVLSCIRLHNMRGLRVLH
jgi:hypothetical protein